MTKYLILQKARAASNPHDSSPPIAETWGVVTSIEANSADEAIRATAAKTPSQPASNLISPVVLVAIPERSWKPRAVKTEQTTKVSLS